MLAHILPKPLNLTSYQRTNDMESQATIVELSKILSSLVGNPENEELLLGRNHGHSTHNLYARRTDKHNMHKASKLGASLVASQLLLYDNALCILTLVYFSRMILIRLTFSDQI